MNNTNVVYLHVKKGTNDVFYVGIGKNKRRAFSKRGRNKHWHHIVNKYDYDVRIVNSLDSYEDAKSTEIELIEAFGRKHYGGQLCNITSGGDSNDTHGMLGKTHSDETKKKMSKSAEISHRERWKHLPQKVKYPRGFLLRGELNGMYGRSDDNPAARSCHDGDGNVFPTIMRAAEFHGIKYTTAAARVNRNNKGWGYEA